MTSLFILLGVLLSSLTVYAEVKPQAGLDVNQIKGKWYQLGYASNLNWFITRVSTYYMGFNIFTFNANGDLKMKFEGQAGDECRNGTFQGKKGSEAGVYIFEFIGHSYTYTFTEVKDPNYAFLHINLAEGTVTKGVIFKLLGRSQEVSDDVKNKWKRIVKDLEIKDKNVLFPPKKEGCGA